jgi:hypothetical protein
MANIDFDTTPVVERNETKIFGTVETSVDFAKTFGEDLTLQRALSALQRGPGRSETFAFNRSRDRHSGHFS